MTASAAVDWRALLVCVSCRGRLSWSSEHASCTACDATYPIFGDIAILLAARDAHKVKQASFFDAAPAEFEITRPRTTTRLYRHLIDEKFRRSVASLRPLLRGSTVVNVCGGSGMDAEFLARAGAYPCVVDISLEAAMRARERARRGGLEIFSVVADAEALPFADHSVDLAFVHDGLHHLERPFDGLSEMARIARQAVSVNEPARAAATAIAVQLGLSETEEEAGNRIGRLRSGQVAAKLESFGFRVRRNERYAMVYRHEPGRASRLLSLPVLYGATRASLAAFNAVAGGVGNKMTVQAVREEPAASGRL